MNARYDVVYPLAIGAVSAVAAAAASIPFHGLTAVVAWVATAVVCSVGLGLWVDHVTDKDGSR